MRKSTATHAAKIKQISLLIADDASIIRRALRRMLQDISELSIVGDCPVGELISQARKFHPDVALIDVVDATVKHVELTKSLRELAKSVEVIIMSQFKHTDIIRAFFEAGGGACLATMRRPYVVNSDTRDIRRIPDRHVPYSRDR